MDVNVDPFDEHGKTDEATGGTDTIDERIPLIPMGGGGDFQIDPSGEQKTPFEGARLETRVKEEMVKGLYEKLAKELNQNPEVLHYELFDIRGKDLYFIDFDKPLTTRGRLKTAKTLVDMLGVKKLREMDFNIPIGVTARQAAMLNKTAEELPSASAINRANDIEMQEIMERAITVNKDLLNEISSDRGTQTGEDDPDQPTMHELVGLDKELRSIRGSLKVEVAKKVELEQKLEREKTKLETLKNSPDLDQDGELKRVIEAKVSKLEEDLKVRQESIDLLKGRLTDQITSFKETIAKVLDKDKSLGERIKTLFREQGITIFSILTAIGMAIGVLVEAVLPRSTAASTAAHGGEGGDTSGSAKEWIRNKLKALASLFGKLAEKLGAALPGIIGSVVAWLLNRAKEVVGWISRNLWSLVLLCVWMVYDYMKKKK